MSVDTWATFDLKTEEPGGRIVHRRNVRNEGPGAHFSRQVDHRPILEYVVSIKSALPMDLWRLGQLWEQTRDGILPMSYPEAVHGIARDGDQVVVFADREGLRREIGRGLMGSFDVVLRGWRG